MPTGRLRALPADDDPDQDDDHEHNEGNQQQLWSSGQVHLWGAYPLPGKSGPVHPRCWTSFGSSRCLAVAQISGRRALAALGRRAGDNRETSSGRRSARFPPPPSLKPRQSANCFEAIVCSAPMALYRVESSTANHRA